MATNRPRTPSAAQFLWLAHGLLLLTVYGSIIPLRFEPMPVERAVGQFLQMRHYDPTLVGARGDWVVNMAQYASVSFCYMAAFCVDRRWAFGAGTAALVVPIGWLAAGAIEFLQVYFPPRTVSTNDIQVECAGIVAGVVAWLAAGDRFVGWLRRFWGMAGLAGLARQALPGFVALLLIASLMPFDVVFDLDEVALKARQGRVRLVPLGSLGSGKPRAWLDLLVTLPSFAPLGALVALAPSRRNRPWSAILLLGAAAAAAIESAQLFVFSRFCDLTDVLLGAAAVLLGWWLARVLSDRRDAERLGGLPMHRAWTGARFRLGRWGPGRWVALAGVWAVLLTLLNWSPFDFSTDPSRFRGVDPDLTDENTRVFWLRRMVWAPFVDYYWGSRYDALDQILRRSCAAAPIGASLALAFGRRERLGALVATLGVMLLGAVIEVGQFFIPRRHPGTTDVLILALGGWLGFKLTRHVAHALEPDRRAEGRDATGSPGPRRADRPGPRRPAMVAGWTARMRPVASRIARRADGFERWLGARPPGVRYLVIGTAAIAASTGFLLLLLSLGIL